MSIEITNCFYIILCSKRTLHLTFDHNKHLKALTYVKKIFPSGDIEAIIKKITEKNLKRLLGEDIKELPPIQNNPFIDMATPFQRRTWKLISGIPYGETRTYGDLALTLGNISLARPVGQACNANPLAIFIPCHRVTAKKGPGGFAGGEGMKKRLLELENEGI